MKSILVGSLLAAIVASAGLSPVSAKAAGQEHISSARAAAIHECSVKASHFPDYAWGDVELYVYRECMFDEGQAE
jgi:hypothetical protein